MQFWHTQLTKLWGKAMKSRCISTQLFSTKHILPLLLLMARTSWPERSSHSWHLLGPRGPNSAACPWGFGVLRLAMGKKRKKSSSSSSEALRPTKPTHQPIDVGHGWLINQEWSIIHVCQSLTTKYHWLIILSMRIYQWFMIDKRGSHPRKQHFANAPLCRCNPLIRYKSHSESTCRTLWYPIGSRYWEAIP